MSYRNWTWIQRLIDTNAATCASAVVVALVAGCHDRERAHDVAQERLDPAGAALTIVRKSQEAIGLEFAEVTRRAVREELALTGWLITTPGREVTVKAPMTGFILPPEGYDLPTPGATTEHDRPLARLQAFVSPIEQAQLVAAKEESDIAIEQAKVSMELAKQQLDKLKYAETAVSGTRLLQLEETIRRSEVAIREAQEKLPFLPDEPYLNPPGLKPHEIIAPINGRVVQLHVLPRQLVVQGDALWTLADWSTLWVRVPVFETDLANVAPNQAASLVAPGSREPLRGIWVDAPQPAEVGRRTIDVFYEVANPKQALRPGMAVAVRLLMADGAEREQIVVPRGAVLWDGLGNAWAYRQESHERFRRARVELGSYLPDGNVAIERGLEEGERVVTAGAEALYGEEFKADLPVEDDD